MNTIRRIGYWLFMALLFGVLGICVLQVILCALYDFGVM